MNSGMRCDKSVEVAKAKAGAMVRTSDGADHERTSRDFVRAENLGSTHLALAIQADQPLTYRVSRRRLELGARSSTSFLHRGDDLAITGTAAEHAADGVHYFIFAG